MAVYFQIFDTFCPILNLTKFQTAIEDKNRAESVSAPLPKLTFVKWPLIQHTGCFTTKCYL